MRHVRAIMRRELRSYFASPTAYVVLTIFTLITGYFFYGILTYYIRQSYIADLQMERLGHSAYQLDVPTTVIEQFFRTVASLLVMVLPVMTMGLITDERRRGTLELLLTSPVRPGELVAGKFLGGLAFFLVVLSPTVVTQIFLATRGHAEPGAIAAAYVGLGLLGAADIALGLFVSSVCENILVSAFGTYGILLALWFIDVSSSSLKSIWVDFLNYFSFYWHYADFAKGTIGVKDAVYFASYIVFGLFLTHRSLESIRWRG